MGEIPKEMDCPDCTKRKRMRKKLKKAKNERKKQKRFFFSSALPN